MLCATLLFWIHMIYYLQLQSIYHGLSFLIYRISIQLHKINNLNHLYIWMLIPYKIHLHDNLLSTMLLWKLLDYMFFRGYESKMQEFCLVYLYKFVMITLWLYLFSNNLSDISINLVHFTIDPMDPLFSIEN
jgi:hypothetical protein